MLENHMVKGDYYDESPESEEEWEELKEKHYDLSCPSQCPLCIEERERGEYLVER